MHSQTNSPFDSGTIESIAQVLGSAGSGSDIDRYLKVCNLQNTSDISTKWRRLYAIFMKTQEETNSPNQILRFIREYLNPTRFVSKKDEFESYRRSLNEILILNGLEYGADREFKLRPRTELLNELEEDFLEKEFKDVSLEKLNIESDLLLVLEKRLEETKKCLKNNIPLSCIFSIGSLLEGLLLDAATKSPSRFNQSTCCPKDENGKVLNFPKWTLAQLIDVCHDIGLLKLDVKKHSHSVRDFRNYIHPHQQIISYFDPDIHTAKICFQVLKAAVADLSGERHL